MKSGLHQKKKQKLFGVLGLDDIEDDSYKKFQLMFKHEDDTTNTNAKKFSLYPFGMSEKLFLPKSQHEKISTVFKRFTKALDNDFKQKEKTLSSWLEKASQRPDQSVGSFSQKQMEPMDLEPISEFVDTQLKD